MVLKSSYDCFWQMSNHCKLKNKTFSQLLLGFCKRCSGLGLPIIGSECLFIQIKEKLGAFVYYYNHAMSFLAMHYNDGVSLLKSDYRLKEWGLLVPHEVEDASYTKKERWGWLSLTPPQKRGMVHGRKGWVVGKILLTPHQEGFGSKMRSLLQGHKERGGGSA